MRCSRTTWTNGLLELTTPRGRAFVYKMGAGYRVDLFARDAHDVTGDTVPVTALFGTYTWTGIASKYFADALARGRLDTLEAELAVEPTEPVETPASEGRRRAILMGCSASKRPDARPLPAYERYTGPLWQTWRAAHAELAGCCASADQALETFPVTLVLSAAEGFMRDCREIPDYDRRLDRARAHELATTERQLDQLAHYLEGLDELVLCAGAQYRGCVREALLRLAARGDRVPAVREIRGRGIGDMRAALRREILAHATSTRAAA